MRRIVICMPSIFLKNKDLRSIHLRDFVKIVQYHDLGFLTFSLKLDTLDPEKVVLIYAF